MDQHLHVLPSESGGVNINVASCVNILLFGYNIFKVQASHLYSGYDTSLLGGVSTLPTSITNGSSALSMWCDGLRKLKLKLKALASVCLNHWECFYQVNCRIVSLVLEQTCGKMIH